MGWMMNGRFFIISLKVNEIYNCLLSYDYTALCSEALQYHIWSNLYLTY
jgi:hypothetical protein